MNRTIPDLSRTAISEGLDAAILRAAFLELEDEEMNRYRKEIKAEEGIQPDRAAFVRSLNARIACRRTRVAFTCTLPRLMQIVACFVTIIALGTGFALAASETARQWAAGILTTGIENYKTENMFAEDAPVSYFGNQPTAGYNSGLEMDGELWLLGGANNENTIYRQKSTHGTPAVYAPLNVGNKSILHLTAGEGALYCMHYDRSSGRYGLDRIVLGEWDYSLITLVEFEDAQLFPVDGRSLISKNVEQLQYFDGNLLFVTSWEYAGKGGSAGERHVRLAAWNIARRALDVIEVPVDKWDWTMRIELFPGVDGAAYIALSDAESGCMRVGKFDAELKITSVAELPCEEGFWVSGFACSPEGDTLYYLYNGAVYAAPGFDASQARCISASNADYGQGVCIGGSYVLVNELGAAIFDLADAGAEIAALVVGGESSEYYAEERFIREYPDTAVTRDDKWMQFDGDVQAMLEAGEADADVYILSYDNLLRFVDEGLCTPLEDAQLLEVAQRLLPEVRESVSIDGRLMAFPIRGYAYSDFSFNSDCVEKAGINPRNLPGSWEEMLILLKGLSNSANAQDYCLAESADFGKQVLERMVSDYAQLCAAEGRQVCFAEDSFVSLLALWREIDFDAFRYVPAEEYIQMEDSTGFYAQEEVLLYPGGSYDLLHGSEDLLLSCSLHFGKDAPLITRASGYFAVIHPTSDQKELAQQYILSYLYTADDADEVVNLYAQPELEKLHWELPAETCALYRSRIGRLYFPDTRSMWDAQKEYEVYSSRLSDYAEGKIGEAELLQALAQFHDSDL